MPDNCCDDRRTTHPTRTSAAATCSTASAATTSSTARPAPTRSSATAQDDQLYGNSGNDWIDGGTGTTASSATTACSSPSRSGVAEPLFGLAATTQVDARAPATADGDDVVADASTSPATLTYTARRAAVLRRRQRHHLRRPRQRLPARRRGRRRDVRRRGAAATTTATAATRSASSPRSRRTTRPATSLGFDWRHRPVPLLRPERPVRKIMVDVGGADRLPAQLRLGARRSIRRLRNGAQTVVDDGQDVLFGDAGNDWLVGGTNPTILFGGCGNDLLQADDNLDSTKVTTSRPAGDLRQPLHARDVVLVELATKRDHLCDELNRHPGAALARARLELEHTTSTRTSRKSPTTIDSRLHGRRGGDADAPRCRR